MDDYKIDVKSTCYKVDDDQVSLSQAFNTRFDGSLEVLYVISPRLLKMIDEGANTSCGIEIKALIHLLGYIQQRIYGCCATLDDLETTARLFSGVSQNVYDIMRGVYKDGRIR